MEFRLPPLDGIADWSGDAPDEAEVAKLLIGDGGLAEKGDDLVELSLDKVNVVLQAPVSGTVRWHVEVGDLVTAGAPLASID